MLSSHNKEPQPGWTSWWRKERSATPSLRRRPVCAAGTVLQEQFYEAQPCWVVEGT